MMHHRLYIQPWTCFETTAAALVSYMTLRCLYCWYRYIILYSLSNNNSALLKVTEVNGSGPTTLSFGSYYGPSQVHGKVGLFFSVHHTESALQVKISFKEIIVRDELSWKCQLKWKSWKKWTPVQVSEESVSSCVSTESSLSRLCMNSGSCGSWEKLKKFSFVQR